MRPDLRHGFMLLHRAFVIVYFRPGSRAPLRVIAPADTRRLTIRF